MRYVMPFFDDDMEGHQELQELLSKKSKGRGQCYTYYIPDKDCTLVISHQMERAIRDKQIIDVTMAQRSEKIVVKLSDETKITLPLVQYDGNAPFYRGEGWTRKRIEEFHHHGKETMSLAKLFEAKESGVEEWELEMMRLANKRRRKMKGEGTADWKLMMQAAAENMDWDKFEEEARTIVEEIKEPVEDDKIPMEVDNMEKTKNINEKLKNAGPEVLGKLPQMPEIPELVRLMSDGTFTEMANVSGMQIQLESSGQERFVAGQMVKSDEGEIFMPGQTLEKEDGTFEYTPGFTIVMDNEVTLLPGLVMGDTPEKPMFLPGESSITENGELQFVETEEDRDPNYQPPPPEPEEETKPEQPKTKKIIRKVIVKKVAPAPVAGAPPPPPPQDSSSEEVSEEEEEELDVPKPVLPKKPPPKFEYERPKRIKQESQGIKRRERRKSMKIVKSAAQKALESLDTEPVKPYVPKKVYDMSSVQLEKDILQQEKERVKNLTAKKDGEERSINTKRREIRILAKKLLESLPRPKYEPLEPVKKSEKLLDLEASIKKGTFFTTDHKKFIVTRSLRRRKYDWKEPFQFQNVFDTVGINRYKLWKCVVESQI
ncbi:hypothetical protein MML48_2g00000337 [Holotrichia oblita]|uniref:Uncharacterized protein n=1 Tax=Holotrichia oblita TaxID=644536 RepID=A0ACB9TJM6_HOLOL|nr:hypothetical protein MML48_2g00000337 [Holotrichia oblita]